MSKKILIHTLVFSPDGVSTAYLYNDIAIGFRDYGYDVVVLTTTPHYNLIKAELEKQPLTRCWGGLYYKSSFHGILVYHLPQKKFKNFPARVAGFVFLHVLSLVLGLTQRKISLILSPSPPLTIGLVSIIIGKIKKARVIYNVQEIYPDFLINQGNLKTGIFLSLLKKLEKFVYDYSDKVITIDDVFYRTIVGRFKNPSKLVVIPNFVDTDIYRPIPRDDLNLDPSTFPDTSLLKIMYAGNIGHAQDWEPLLAVAALLKEEPTRFFVIGEGVAKEKLAQEIRIRQLSNISLLPYQPRQNMAKLANYADLHFIFMNPQMEGQGFPSKVYTIMACKKPLLVTSGLDTPLYQFLMDKNCAFLIAESEVAKKCKQIENVLRKIMTDKSVLSEMGENGFRSIHKSYSKTAVVGQYIKLGNNLLSTS